MRVKSSVQFVLLIVLLSFTPVLPARTYALVQEQPSGTQRQSAPPGPGEELAKETREAAGEDEENENLKHSSMVQKLAQVTGMSVHDAHLVALGFNFALIIFLVYWLGRKSVPQALRNRTESIRRALEEARAASQDANRRLAEIEARLQKLDTEISKMQATAEQEAAGEEARIRTAAEDDMRKVVLSAEQEIAAAAKQARRELTVLTADLAITLAQQQIRVDSDTDQALVRNFAGELSKNGGKDGQ